MDLFPSHSSSISSYDLLLIVELGLLSISCMPEQSHEIFKAEAGQRNGVNSVEGGGYTFFLSKYLLQQRVKVNRGRRQHMEMGPGKYEN